VGRNGEESRRELLRFNLLLAFLPSYTPHPQ
jgi:hypothetical protein